MLETILGLLAIITMVCYKGAVVLATLLFFMIIAFVILLSIMIVVCTYNEITKHNKVES